MEMKHNPTLWRLLLRGLWEPLFVVYIWIVQYFRNVNVSCASSCSEQYLNRSVGVLLLIDHSPTQRVEVTHPRSQGHHEQPGWGSRCLDFQPRACVHGTPSPQLSGLFWAASHASCLLASLPGSWESCLVESKQRAALGSSWLPSLGPVRVSNPR